MNFIFNALFLDIVKIYLFEHGRKINELTFNECVGILVAIVVGTQEGEIQLLPYTGIGTTYVGDMVPNFSSTR